MHTRSPDSRSIPEWVRVDNVANSYDIIMNLLMVNVYFKVPGVIVS